MIYLLYGQPGSGKTVLGQRLAAQLLTTYHIDGDEFRALFSNSNYGKTGREENIKNANAVATFLNRMQEGDVVLSLVNPYQRLRDELKQNNIGQVVDILLVSTRKLRNQFHVEEFEIGSPKITLNTDRGEDVTFNSLISCIAKRDLYG